jgi:hypothetical protein
MINGAQRALAVAERRGTRGISRGAKDVAALVAAVEQVIDHSTDAGVGLCGASKAEYDRSRGVKK